MFEAAWEKVIAAAGGVENLAPPKEIVWLNGAPGAGTVVLWDEMG